MIEPGHPEHGIFPEAIQADFGNTVESFNDEKFQEYSREIKKTGIKQNGAYMPCLFL